ncbi:MAG: S49 family peptidase, partial [bacterium]|nr:S49 family peptidase [bacterium]
MKRIHTLLVLLIATLLFGSAIAQTNQPSQINGIGISSHPITSMAMTNGTLALWGNPAALGITESFGFLAMVPSDDKDFLKDRAFAVRAGPFAWSGEYINDVPTGALKPRIYNWGMGVELEDGVYFGARYRYSKNIPQQNSWSFGLLVRPYSWLSVGAVARDANQPRYNDIKQKAAFDAGFGFRPLALTSWKHGHRVSVGADITWYELDSRLHPVARKYGDKMDPRYHIEVEPIDGVQILAQYASEYKEMRVGIGFASQHTRIHHSTRSDDKKTQGGLSYILYESDGMLSLPVQFQPKLVKMKMPSAFDDQQASFSFFAQRNPELEKFLEKIRRLTKDKDVKGLVLEVNELNIGMAKLQAVTRELRKFKAAGKKIYIYTKSLNNRGYALASLADKLYIHPEGDIFLVGFASGGLFLKGTLDKLGVEVEVDNSGPHKTAGNMLSESHMTAEDRAQREWLFGDLYRQFAEMIAQNRGWSVDDVKRKIDDGPYLASGAKEANLVDGTLYADEVEKTFKDLYGNKKIKIQSASSYFMEPEIDPRWDRPMEPKIAVVYAVGEIKTGRSSSGIFGGRTMGSETMVKAIRAARKNKHVKAIVLR